MRYADDFIIGIEGSYELTQEILGRIEQFINEELGLKLNETKTGVARVDRDPVKFLGYKLMGPNMRGIEKPVESIRDKTGRVISRRKKIRPRIEMDFEKVLKKMKNEGFIKVRTMPGTEDRRVYRGTYKGTLVNLEHADIVRYYNSVIRGVYNYYSFVNNTDRLAYVIWLLEESCCLTLARKYKWKSMKKVFDKFGRDLGCEVEYSKGEVRRVALVVPGNFKRQPITRLSPRTKDPMKTLEQNWNSKFTKSNLHKACIVCGVTQGVEMHHVRQIRELRNPKGKQDFFTRQMEAINRKQIPLCRDHHNRLHRDTWTPGERQRLTEISKKKEKKQE